MSSRQNPGFSQLQLPELLAQVDRLEQEVRDLGREVEREESQASHREEMIVREQEREARLRLEISNISKETLEWEDRERFLSGAIESSYQNYQVLQQMEVEGRAKLSQETQRTDDLMKSLKVQLDALQNKYLEDMKILAQLPGFAQEKEINDKKEKLAKIEEENKKLSDQIEESRRRKKKEWESFVKSCIELARKGLEAKEKMKKFEASKTRLMQSSKTNKEDSAVGNMEVDDPIDLVEEAGATARVLEVLEPDVEEAEKVGDTSPLSSQEEMSEEILDTPSESQKSLSPQQPPSPIQIQEEAVDSTPVLSVKEPSTPKTKPFSFALGTSFMSSLMRGIGSPRKEKMPQIRKESSDQEMEDSSGGSSSVKSPHPSDIPSESQQPSISAQFPPASVKTPKMKSFKLGMPSFLLKKRDAPILSGQNAEVESVGIGPSVEAVASPSPMKEPSLVLPTRRDESPADRRSEARFQPRLHLSLPKIQAKKEEISRRSLDQFQVSDIRLGSAKPSLMSSKMSAKTLSSDPVAKDAEMPYSEVETRSYTLPKLPKPQKPLASLREDSPKKITTPTLPSLNLLQFVKKRPVIRSQLVSTDDTVAVSSPVDSLRDEQQGGLLIGSQEDKTVEDVTSSSLRQEGLSKAEDKVVPPSLFGSPDKVLASASITSIFSSPGKDDRTGSSFFDSPGKNDKEKRETSANPFGSPGKDTNFLGSPSGGEDFFSKMGNDYFFGGEDDKEGNGDGNDFFADFGDSIFGGEGTEEDKDFFSFGGEEKGDEEDVGFSLF